MKSLPCHVSGVVYIIHAFGLASLLVVVLGLAGCGEKPSEPSDFYNSHWCTDKMRYIDAAKEQYQEANGLTNGAMVVWSNVVPYMRTNNVYCMNGGKYSVGGIGESPSCSVHGAYTNLLHPTPTDP